MVSILPFLLFSKFHHNSLILYHQELLKQLIQEKSIMGNRQDRTSKSFQNLLDFLSCLNIKMIRWFIQNQPIDLVLHDLRQL